MTLFRAYLPKYPEAEPYETVYALLEALSTEEAKSIATRASGSSFNFNKALEALEKRYGQKRLICDQTSFRSIPIDLNYSTISEVIQQLEASLETFKDTVDFYAIAHHTEGLLSSELRKRWTAEAGHMEEQPSLQILLFPQAIAMSSGDKYSPSEASELQGQKQAHSSPGISSIILSVL